MNGLDLAALDRLPADVIRPRYDVARVSVGIIHLGLGAFHRAHQAVYTDDAIVADPRWGICGVSLKTPRATEPLAAQQGLYSVLTKSRESTSARVIGSIRETIFAGANRNRLLDRFTDPRVTIVSATVTEKGYCHDPASGTLNMAHPEIAHDLEHPHTPKSAVGIVVAGLERRRAAGAGPLTFVCCDNLPHNGRLVAALVHAFAGQHDPALAAWIRDHVQFPATMVDRIVPATTHADVVEAERLLGVHDAAPVAAEPFGQWVIENRFAGERPHWEEGGAQFVDDVAPFELMKLRLLNGSHSTLAYLGYLMGYDFVWQASRDPLLSALVDHQMRNETVPTLVQPPGIVLDAYCAQLLERFRNPALPHRTRQIAMDGSQKIPQRWLQTIRDRIVVGAPHGDLTLAVAGWIRYASGTDERGGAIDVQDPLAGTFARMVKDAGGDGAKIADGFLSLRTVFGVDLPAHAAFRDAVRKHVVMLFRDGARSTVAQYLGAA